MFAENYYADIELISVDRRTTYGWDFTSGLPLLQPLAQFPGEISGLDFDTYPISLTDETICFQIRTRLLNSEGENLPLSVTIDGQAVERDRIEVEQTGTTNIYCVPTSQITPGTHKISIVLNVAAASSRPDIQRYRGEFKIDDNT